MFQSANHFLFLDKASNELIGSGGIKNIHLDQSKVLNLYYRLHPESTGYGYAYEAMQSIIEWIYSTGDIGMDFK